jgi:flagellar protein FlaG
MEIGSINQIGQTTSELNVSTVGNTTNIKEVKQEAIVVNPEPKVNQQSDANQTGSGQKILTEKDVEKAVDKLNKLLEDNTTHAEYEFYGKSKNLTVKIVNNKTKEVVQELPPKKIIDMIDKLCELAGIFVDKKA